MLKPTRRIKRRYILIESSKENKEIYSILFEYFGILNFGKLNALIIEKEGKRILRVNRKFYYEVLGVFALEGIKTKRSSGTIKKLLEKE